MQRPQQLERVLSEISAEGTAPAPFGAAPPSLERVLSEISAEALTGVVQLVFSSLSAGPQNAQRAVMSPSVTGNPSASHSGEDPTRQISPA